MARNKYSCTNIWTCSSKLNVGITFFLKFGDMTFEYHNIIRLRSEFLSSSEKKKKLLHTT